MEPKIRATLLDTFGFERRELGQGVSSSEVIGTIQRVRGVEYVDLDLLGSIGEEDIIARIDAQEPGGGHAPGAASGRRDRGIFARAGESGTAATGLPQPVLVHLARGVTRPAQLAILPPGVPDTLILSEVKR